jgi:hypothetical protein
MRVTHLGRAAVLPLGFHAIHVLYAVTLRRMLPSVLTALILFSSSIAASTALRSGLVEPPVIDEQDIRFIPFSVNGESLQSRIWSIARDNYAVPVVWYQCRFVPVWRVHSQMTGEINGSLRRGGLNKLDRSTGSFSVFLHDSRNPHSLGHDYVNFILGDQSGVLWLASPLGSGLTALDVKAGRFTRYSFHAEEPGSQSVVGVNKIHEDADGVLWLCTVDRGLLKLDRERKRFIRHATSPPIRTACLTIPSTLYLKMGKA